MLLRNRQRQLGGAFAAWDRWVINGGRRASNDGGCSSGARLDSKARLAVQQARRRLLEEHGRAGRQLVSLVDHTVATLDAAGADR